MTAPTVTAESLYSEWSDWEGAPPARLCRLDLDRLADAVMDYLTVATPPDDPGTLVPWVSVDLRALWSAARADALAHRDGTGEWPW